MMRLGWSCRRCRSGRCQTLTLTMPCQARRQLYDKELRKYLLLLQFFSDRKTNQERQSGLSPRNVSLPPNCTDWSSILELIACATLTVPLDCRREVRCENDAKCCTEDEVQEAVEEVEKRSSEIHKWDCRLANNRNNCAFLLMFSPFAREQMRVNLTLQVEKRT
jgi:hypothetical protein